MELQKLIEQPQTVFMGIYWLGVYKYPAPPAVLKQRAPKPIGHTMGNGQFVEKMKKTAWFAVERLLFGVERLLFSVVPPWSHRGPPAWFPINPKVNFGKVCKALLCGCPVNANIFTW